MSGAAAERPLQPRATMSDRPGMTIHTEQGQNDC
jgi:hypothetical protein